MTQAQPNACEHCGAPLAGNTTFCGSCGKPVTAPKSADGGGGLKKTMFGIPQQGLVIPVSPRNSVAPAPVENVSAKTEDDPSEAERGHDRSTQEGVVVPPRGQMGRTMLGVPIVQAQAPGSPPAATPEANVAKTMFGLGGIEPPKPPAGPGPGPGPGKNTMMGTADTAPMPDPERGIGVTRRGHVPVDHTLMSLEHAQDGGPASSGDAAPPTPNTDRPLAGPASRPAPRMLTPYTPSGDYPRDSLFSTAPAPARRGSTVAAMVLFGLLAVTAAVLAYLALADRGPDVRVHVVSEAGRDSLEFEVPGAEPDTKVRFGGQEQPLVAGRARFALAADAIRVGENVVLFDLIKADGNAEPGKIGLAVDYRATLDTGPLRAGKAAVDVVVSARPGSKVWLDGVPIMLDKDGRAVRSDPIELGSGQGSIEHVVRYRVEPPGAEAVVGELHTTLALTSLTIDRPGTELVTDQSSVEIAGEVEPNATVTIDGRKVEVRAGRFLDSYPLPKPGEYQPTVSAMAEGKAPRAVKLKLTRVDDLAKAAQSFKVDSALSYAKIAQNPDIYKGQRVAFEGRIYNVSVDQGHSALQMLVRQCSKGQRCPLWVSYPSATDLTVDSWVRVLGTLDGEQQFRSETNELRSVPKLVAAFLVPTKP
jgi:hypothetical protein